MLLGDPLPGLTEELRGSVVRFHFVDLRRFGEGDRLFLVGLGDRLLGALMAGGRLTTHGLPVDLLLIFNPPPIQLTHWTVW
jgi:hypothetical protein